MYFDRRKKKSHLGVILSVGLIVLGVAITLLIVVITYLFFTKWGVNIPSDASTQSSPLQKGDWLTFWGGMVAALCTISLALLAWRQNRTLNKINQEKEGKDTYFTKLRIAAEFYSAIEICGLVINNDNPELKWRLSFMINDIGKFPPSRIYIDQIDVYMGRDDHSDLIERCHLFHGQNIESDILHISSTQRKDGNFTDAGYIFFIDVPDHFKNSYLCCQDNTKDKSEPSLRVNISYVLYNPLEVIARNEGNLTFSNTQQQNMYADEARTQKLFFKTFQPFIKTTCYDFVGDVVNS